MNRIIKWLKDWRFRPILHLGLWHPDNRRVDYTEKKERERMKRERERGMVASLVVLWLMLAGFLFFVFCGGQR